MSLKETIEIGRKQPRKVSLTNLWRFARLIGVVECAVFSAGKHKVDGGPRVPFFGNGVVYVDSLEQAEHFLGEVAGDDDPNVVPTTPLFGTGYYVVPAALDPQLRLRYEDGKWSRATSTATERDITSSNVIVVDVDPVRLSDTNSTNAQLFEAIKLAGKLRDALVACGAPEDALALGESGNGAHLLVALDMPWSPEVKALRHEFLSVLNAMHGTAEHKIDTTMADGARYIPAYGTKKKKAPHRADMPQRRSWLVAPEVVAPLSLEAFQALVTKLKEGMRPEHMAKLSGPKGAARKPPRAGGAEPRGESDLDRASAVSITTVCERLGIDPASPTCPGCGATSGIDVLADKGINVMKCQHETCGAKAWGSVALVAKVAFNLDNLTGDREGVRQVVSWFVSEGLIDAGRGYVPTYDQEAVDKLVAAVPASSRGAELSAALAPIGELLGGADLLELDRVAAALNGRLGRGAPKKVLVDTLSRQRKASVQTAKATKGEAPEGAFLRGDHVEIATRFIDDLGGVENVVFDEGEIHQYVADDGVWSVVDTRVAHRLIGSYAGQPKGSKGELLHMTQGAIEGSHKHAESMASRPGWLRDGEPGFAFRNGFVSILPDGAIELKPHSRDHRAVYRYDFDWDPTRVPLKLVDFYGEIFKGDPEAAVKTQFLLEFYGASLLGEAWRAGKALIKYGLGNDGKSVETQIMQAAFPKGSLSGVSPHDWDDDQKLAKLAGKLLNYAGELSAKELRESATIKAVITGRDMLTAKVVYRPPFDFLTKCGQIANANALPAVADVSKGFWRRWEVVEFTRYFKPEEENKMIVEEVTADLQGIACTLIKAAAQYVANGYAYTKVPPSSEQLRNDWMNGSEPVRRWLNEQCKAAAPGSTMPFSSIWPGFRDWLQKQGHAGMSAATFRARLNTIIRELVRTNQNWVASAGMAAAEISKQGFVGGGDSPQYPIAYRMEITNDFDLS